ncbi:MAG: Spy/CpxP family protein refolding chaperone [Gemmatimonadales bacterium]
MRRIAFASLVIATLVACSSDNTTSPATSTDQQVTDFSIDAFGSVLTSAGGYDAELYELRLFHALPDDLKLTSDQETQIKALVEAYKKDTKADNDALDAILKQAREAVKAKKTAAEVKAILDHGAPIVAKLNAAAEALKTKIDAILTPAQRAWLADHAPKKCKKGSFPPLTDAQKALMKGYEQAFEQQNKADLATVKAGMDQIKGAVTSGKTPAEIQAILDSIKPALDRLATARKTLHTQLESVLTAEQKASGCLPLG